MSPQRARQCRFAHDLLVVRTKIFKMRYTNFVSGVSIIYCEQCKIKKVLIQVTINRLVKVHIKCVVKQQRFRYLSVSIGNSLKFLHTKRLNVCFKFRMSKIHHQETTNVVVWLMRTVARKLREPQSVPRHSCARCQPRSTVNPQNSNECVCSKFNVSRVSGKDMGNDFGKFDALLQSCCTCNER